MTIISIDAINGAHCIESQSHRKEVWKSGYIEVPSRLCDTAWDSGGYCELTIEDGKLINIIPIDKPEVQETVPPISQEEQLRADVDYLAALQGVTL